MKHLVWLLKIGSCVR